MNMPQDPRNGPPPVGRMVRLGLWALPVWAVLLFYSTLSHQPPPRPTSHPAHAPPGRTQKHHKTASDA